MKTHQMPVFKPARRKRLHEEIVGQIRTLIDEGELKSGDKLPPGASTGRALRRFPALPA